MQVAAALNAQQYRSNLPGAAYIKGVNSQMSDQASRAQQLKSPSSQEVLSSVFNTGKYYTLASVQLSCMSKSVKTLIFKGKKMEFLNCIYET